MRVYLSVRGTGAIIPLPDGWPSVAEFADLAEAMSRTTRECPVCPNRSATAAAATTRYSGRLRR